MSFRLRLLIAFLLAALLPVLALAWIVRSEMDRRLTAQYERRVEAQVAVIEQDLARQSVSIEQALNRLKAAIRDDNRFRAAAVDHSSTDRSYLLDYAGDARDLADLSMLQIQDGAGRIISSGHFRNEYDRLEPELPASLIKLGAAGLIEARAPEGNFLALVRADSFSLAGQPFSLVGGRQIDAGVLAGLRRDEEVRIGLLYPGGELNSTADSSTLSTEYTLVRNVPIPFIGESEGEAEFRVLHPLTELAELRAGVDRWFRIVGLTTALLAIGAAIWLSTRISRPLAELAEKTSRVDLDRLDIDFRSRRSDEFGALSRLLGAMTDRLRKSAAAIKDAERRAVVGEMARQVNHDIKNSLTPIRNVFRHLTQLATDAPAELPGVLQERQETLESSMNYLQDLAANYARLTPKQDRQPCDLNAMIVAIARDLRNMGRARVDTRLAGKAVVQADPLSLRRIVENLIDNAIDSLPEGKGTIHLTTEAIEKEGRPIVRLIVADQGRGMTPDQIAAAFTDFYTTKERGTGLGLSIVRRLVMDLDGSIRVESEPGQGSRFIVEFPG